jgi:MerR family transcriptional regulator, light-induced transcriptional regulator
MQSFSPRQLARAAGVSESSVKRWCDQGLIPTQKTAGGHRRLAQDAASEFLRHSHPDAQFELLGLPPRRAEGPLAADDFYRALISGSEDMCRQIVFDLHYRGERASRIFDTVIAPAFVCVGRGWECNEVEVFQERRGCGICLRVLDELKSMIPQPKSTAPIALGATPECDPYMLPTSMVEIVLRQSGWQAQSLGSHLPFATLLAAIRQLKPQLLWLSVSHVDDEQRFLALYREFYAEAETEVPIVVGGRALTESLRRQMEFTAYCDDLRHLESLARTLKKAAAPGGKPGRARAASSKKSPGWS